MTTNLYRLYAPGGPGRVVHQRRRGFSVRGRRRTSRIRCIAAAVYVHAAIAAARSAARSAGRRAGVARRRPACGHVPRTSDTGARGSKAASAARADAVRAVRARGGLRMPVARWGSSALCGGSGGRVGAARWRGAWLRRAAVARLHCDAGARLNAHALRRRLACGTCQLWLRRCRAGRQGAGGAGRTAARGGAARRVRCGRAGPSRGARLRLGRIARADLGAARLQRRVGRRKVVLVAPQAPLARAQPSAGLPCWACRPIARAAPHEVLPPKALARTARYGDVHDLPGIQAQWRACLLTSASLATGGQV